MRARYRLPFTRLMPASFESLEQHLSRVRRQYGKPPRYVHFAAHANADGVLLREAAGGERRLYDAYALSEILDGVEVVVLDGCESTEIGDELGVVPWVVTMGEAIPQLDATRFAEVFWSRIGAEDTPFEAYRKTEELLPNLAEYVHLHV